VRACVRVAVDREHLEKELSVTVREVVHAEEQLKTCQKDLAARTSELSNFKRTLREAEIALEACIKDREEEREREKARQEEREKEKARQEEWEREKAAQVEQEQETARQEQLQREKSSRREGGACSKGTVEKEVQVDTLSERAREREQEEKGEQGREQERARARAREGERERERAREREEFRGIIDELEAALKHLCVLPARKALRPAELRPAKTTLGGWEPLNPKP